MAKKSLRQKIIAEWKAIDRILGVNAYELSESKRKKYNALKSLAIKESENFIRGIGAPRVTEELLTENTKKNINILYELSENILLEACKKNKKIAKKISECDVSNNKKEKIKVKLESILLGDAIDYMVENKKFKLEDLGLNISRQLLEAYIDSLVQFSYI